MEPRSALFVVLAFLGCGKLAEFCTPVPTPSSTSTSTTTPMPCTYTFPVASDYTAVNAGREGLNLSPLPSDCQTVSGQVRCQTASAGSFSITNSQPICLPSGGGPPPVNLFYVIRDGQCLDFGLDNPGTTALFQNVVREDVDFQCKDGVLTMTVPMGSTPTKVEFDQITSIACGLCP